MSQVVCWLASLAVAIASAGALAKAQGGETLAEALVRLQASGLRIIYSSEVVRPEMRVVIAARAKTARRILDEILAPHGLIAQDGPRGSVLIVKNPRVRTERKPAVHTPSSTAPLSPATSKAEDDPITVPRYAETVDVTGAEPWGTGVGAPSFAIHAADVRAFAGGLDNVFRALQALPGIAGTDELGSRMTVRGGAPDQNLTILDGVEIYNPFRVYVPSEDLGMSGITSAFNVDTIESAELSPGAFDVRHGDRLSSLLLVKHRDGSSTETFQGSSTFSLSDASIAMEGRLPRRANGSWLISARRTHFDLVLDRLLGTNFPTFHDVQAKVVWQLSPTKRVSLLALAGRERTGASDRLQADDEVYSTNTTNNLAAATFESSIGSRVSSRTIASFAGFDDEFAIAEQSLSNSRGANTEASLASGGRSEFQLARTVAVADAALRQEITLRPSAKHVFDLGFDTHWLDTAWGWRVAGDRSYLQADGSSVRLGTSLPAVFDSARHSYRIGTWLQDRIHLTSRVVVQSGVRIDRSSLTRETTISPRLSAAIDAGPTTRVAMAVRMHAQSPGYEKLFQSDYFVDLSQSNTTKLKAERALHVVGGVQHAFGRSTSVRIDGYYRRFADLVVGRLESEAERLTRLAGYDVPGSLWPTVPQRAEIMTMPSNAGTGHAYGVEVHLAQYGGAATPLTGWASYTLARATRTVYGVTHPFDYDRRHAVSVAANLKLGPRLDLSATARWATGFPRTAAHGVRLALAPDTSDADGDGNRDEHVPQRDVFGNPMFQPDFGELSNLNRARLPQFARVDLRVTYRPTWSRERWAFYFDIVNVLNRRNVGLMDNALIFVRGADRPGIIELAENNGLPFLPSFGMRFWF